MQPQQPEQPQADQSQLTQSEQPQPRQQAPTQPSFAPEQPGDSVPKKKNVKLALWLLIGPSALFVIGIVVSIASFMFGLSGAALSAVNIFIFLVIAIVVLAWLPCLIAGIIILAKK